MFLVHDREGHQYPVVHVEGLREVPEALVVSDGTPIAYQVFHSYAFAFAVKHPRGVFTWRNNSWNSQPAASLSPAAMALPVPHETLVQ